MILDKIVKTRWVGRTKKYYEGLGYKFTKKDAEFEVCVEHLYPYSDVKIRVKCDLCGSENLTSVKSLRIHGKLDLYTCKSCTLKKTNGNKIINGARSGKLYSFYNFCLDNNRKDLLDRWDYEKNGVAPNEVTCKSHKKYYFKCPNGIHDSEEKYISVVTATSSQDVICSVCNSFGQYLLDQFGKDAIDKYWGNSNIISPFSVSCFSNEHIYINCVEKEYHSEYQISAYNFANGGRCSYCSGHNVVHPNDSFAAFHIKEYGDDFLNDCWDYQLNKIDPYTITPYSLKKIYVYCRNESYHKSYLISAAHFTNGKRCPYCCLKKVHKLDSLGAQFPKSIESWSNKNNKTPFEYAPKSKSDIWWKCENGIHSDYKRIINNSTNLEFRCPECVRERKISFLAEKVNDYLKVDCGYQLNHEYNCTLKCINPKTNYQLPFDVEVVQIKLICEIHGVQHYSSQTYETWWKNKKFTSEEALDYQQWRDKYKKDYVLSKGYSYLEIPYWAEKDDQYKKLIDNKIAEILSKQEQQKGENAQHAS